MPFVQLIAQALATESRSTTLRTLGWMLAILTAGTVSCPKLDAPPWLTILMGVCLGLTVLVYFAAYVYFALTDKDCLRSERFSIEKLAIEKGLKGDDLTGYVHTKVEEIPAATGVRRLEGRRDERT